ncbi:MAG: hypothetical protein IPM56_11465 [Ignavibacteriales bacterium]|nr:MAG: hypothetical protein IPM56_11465 [Ignavibacteriales bacterium]
MKLHSQSFGFGCLGFVGGYGGYNIQNFNPKGLNDYIVVYNELRSDSLTSPMESFGKASGYRVGINFFRAQFTGVILTAKGFYQSLKEKHESLEKFQTGIKNTTFDLALRNWGVGIDLGIPISNALSWKIVDGALHFNNVSLTSTENFPGADTDVKKYTSESTLGYSVGTGFIFSIIEGYISIEGSAGYTVLSIDRMKLNETTFLTKNENSNEIMENFIEAGGFSALIQLNIGFPL